MNAFIRPSALLVALSLFGATIPVHAADEEPTAKQPGTAAAKEAKPAEKGEKKSPADYRGPLPFYYSKVVSPDQKEKIYAVQEKYAAELKSLQAKVRELEEARNKEVDAVLSAEQLARIKELREEAAKAKTQPKAPASAAPNSEAEKKPAEKKSE